MELSPVVATLVPLVGIAVSINLGMRAAASDRTSYWGAAFLVALVLGLGLTLIQVVLHGLCIDALHLCKNRGDGNMTYWLQSLFAFPAFWLAAGGTWQLKK